MLLLLLCVLKLRNPTGHQTVLETEQPQPTLLSKGTASYSAIFLRFTLSAIAWFNHDFCYSNQALDSSEEAYHYLS